MSDTPEQPVPVPVERPVRTENGRFAKGNKIARGGDPMAGRRQKFRAALLKELTAGDIRQITKWLIREAKDGNMAAIKELLDRALPNDKTGETNVNVMNVIQGNAPTDDFLQLCRVDVSNTEPDSE